MTEQTTRDAAVEAAEQPSTSQTTALAVREKRAELARRVQQGLEEQTPRIEAYLAKLQRGDPERFRMAVLEAVTSTPAIADCTANSIVQAALQAAQLGLEPTGILGGAYLVPYKNSRTRLKEAKLIVGYRGYIDLIHRAGGVKSIEARVVYEGDAFEVEFGTQKKIRHVPAFLLGKDPGDRRGVYWIAEMAGETQFDVLSMDEIEKARKSSKARDDGPWIVWYDEMAKKTAIRRAVKLLAISVYEARRAVQLEDQAEEESEPIRQARADAATATARDRALALLDGEPGEDPPPGDAAGEEAPPDAEPEDDTSAGEESHAGRPVTSELDSEEGLP